jgi:beta-galactosidase
MKMRLRIVYILLLLCGFNLCYAADTLSVGHISPVPVSNTGEQWAKSLAGTWLFNPAPEAHFEKNTSWGNGWKPIQVPGEWVMQGFKVKINDWAGYVSTPKIPAAWVGKRVKIRCDGVYSEAEVYINGKLVVRHMGGFTPFEADITNLLEPQKEAVIAVKVKNESIADTVSAATSYAVHPLGGITRKIQLIALPDLNVGAFQVNTTFDKAYNNAELSTQVTLRNESRSSQKPVLLFELLSPDKGATVFSRQVELGSNIKSDSSLSETYHFDIPHPLKWDSEHPYLYKYRLTVLVDGRATEVTERKIGFRQIEVRGNQVFVNNAPVKLRGACYHNVMPLRGRSVTAEQTIEDVRIFAAGNVNYLRTSHYPPMEELVQACDSIGMFLEVEAPFCWAERGKVSAKDYKAVLEDQTLDMVDFFKSNPSVLIWSIGNESKKYPEYFQKTAALVKEMDSSRPRNFSQYEPNGDMGELEIGNHHYPDTDGPDKYKDSKRPIVFDEYCHINAYNRFELVTDPGLRDAWGIGMAAMWEKMYSTPAVLGGALWGGIDDTFILPDSTAVGFGTWGVIDGWRRLKPEYWHMKKAYSPVKVKQWGNWENGHLSLSIDNRHLFTNLKECQIKWHLGKDSGVVNPDIEHGKSGVVQITYKKPGADQSLKLQIFDARHILIDEYQFNNLVPIVAEQKPVKIAKNAQWLYKKEQKELRVSTSNKYLLFDENNPGNLQYFIGKKQVMFNLAELMVLPLNPLGNGVQMTGAKYEFTPYTSTAANRIITKVTYQKLPNVFVLQVWDTYDDAIGNIKYEFNANGKINIKYSYKLTKDINPRQWGLVFKLLPDFKRISWNRNGLWNAYPTDHVGRLEGTANAVNTQPMSGPAGPFKKPNVLWANDQNALGTNDFRSTKMNVTRLSVLSPDDKITVISDGSQHTRCWVDTDKKIRLLVAAYSNLGAEKFFHSQAVKLEVPLHSGDTIADCIELNMQSLLAVKP